MCWMQLIEICSRQAICSVPWDLKIKVSEIQAQNSNLKNPVYQDDEPKIRVPFFLQTTPLLYLTPQSHNFMDYQFWFGLSCM